MNWPAISARLVPRFKEPWLMLETGGIKVLVGDVGGTNARLAVATVFGDGAVVLSETRRKKVADHANLDAVVQAVGAEIEADGERLPDHAVFALAGPTGAESVHLTNADWTVSSAALKTRFGFSSVTLVNDFAAQARAVPATAADKFEVLKDGIAVADAPIVVLGPGTGLGQALVMPLGKGWRVIPTEGGHQSFAPVSEREQAILALLGRSQDHVSFETLVCGPGLDRIYRSICVLDGIGIRLSGAPEIGPAAVAGDDPAAVEAAEVLSLCLATFAGDAILATGARGGCVIAGGVSEALAPFLRHPRFIARLTAKGPMAPYLGPVPVRRARDSFAALTGAALFAPIFAD
jgi:glucokinase